MHCAVPVDALTPQEALRCPSVGGGVPRESSTAHPPANPDDRKRFHVALASAPSPPPFPAFLRSHQCAVKISHNTGFRHHLRFEFELQKYYMYKLLGSKAGSIMLKPLLLVLLLVFVHLANWTISPLPLGLIKKLGKVLTSKSVGLGQFEPPIQASHWS